MLQITPHHVLLLAIQPLDFRKGIDGLVAVCRQYLRQDPFSGTWFIFANQRRTSVKVLVYDGQGFWCCQKRFSKGTLAWWPKDSNPTFRLTAQQLSVLLYQGNPMILKLPADFRPLAPMSPDTSTVKKPLDAASPLPHDVATSSGKKLDFHRP